MPVALVVLSGVVAEAVLIPPHSNGADISARKRSRRIVKGNGVINRNSDGLATLLLAVPVAFGAASQASVVIV